MHLLILLFVLAVLCVPYFIPAIIAFARNKKSRVAILALNFFLGWSIVGWVVALVWAVKDDVVDLPIR
jgi:Superinfection immunity protein